MHVSLFGKDLDIRHRRSGLIHLRPVNVGSRERVISSLAGAALLLAGLRRGSLVGALLALAGGSFLLRGMTGHCELNEAIGRDSSEEE